MADWIDFDRWPECARMERPGIVFEVEGANGQRMLTPCEVPLTLPPDWQSPPLRFRAIPESEPRHSTPIPAPRSD